MKKNIIKSLLSLILSVSMLVTGLGLTVHADVGGDIGEGMGAGVSTEIATPTEGGQAEGLVDSENGKLEELDSREGSFKKEPTIFTPKGGSKSNGPILFNTPTDLGNIFKSLQLSVDGQEIDDDVTIEITDDTEVLFLFNWELDNGVDLKSGDYATIQIPAAFKAISGHADGPLLFDDDEVGTYLIDDNGLLTVTFNEMLEDMSNREGEVGLLFVFNKTVINENNQQQIVFGDPINKNFIITIKPSGNFSAIEKSGAPDLTINPTHINWVMMLIRILESWKMLK